MKKLILIAALAMSGAAGVQAAPQTVTLDVPGMTCAACANRIEKKLNRLDGVTATVNYATEKANVTFDPNVATPDTLIDRKSTRLNSSH